MEAILNRTAKLIAKVEAMSKIIFNQRTHLVVDNNK